MFLRLVVRCSHRFQSILRLFGVDFEFYTPNIVCTRAGGHINQEGELTFNP